MRRHEEGNRNRPDLADHRCDCGRILGPFFQKFGSDIVRDFQLYNIAKQSAAP